MAAPIRITKPDGTVLELVETLPAEDLHGGRRPARLKARKQALDLLYAIELRGDEAAEVRADFAADTETELRPFARELIEGVQSRRREIDNLIIGSLSAEWTLDRMPRIDRCLARLAIYELLAGEVAAEVAVEQAVSLAAELSTDDSAAFLNGLLVAVRGQLAPLG